MIHFTEAVGAIGLSYVAARGFAFMRVDGISMMPALRPGAVLVVDKMTFRVFGIRAGDVVVFRRRDRQWVKRVIEVQEARIYVAGDNATSSVDSRHFGPVSLKDITGRVVAACAPRARSVSGSHRSAEVVRRPSLGSSGRARKEVE